MRTTFFAFVALGSLGCAGTVNLDEMSAEKHRLEAAKERAAAREDDLEFDPDVMASDSIMSPQGMEVPSFFPIHVYNPTSWHLLAAAEHRDHARQHEEAARELERFEEAECGEFPAESRVACPLLAGVTAIEDIPHGVRLRFVPGAPIDALVAHMRCHYAYARAHGFEEAASCPLYVRGLRIELVDGGAIELTGANPKAVRTIRKLARPGTLPPAKGVPL